MTPPVATINTRMAMRILRAVASGLGSEEIGTMRTPHDGQRVAVSSIGSTQRQHALAITAPFG